MVKFTSAIKTHLEEINVYRMFKKEDSQEKKTREMYLRICIVQIGKNILGWETQKQCSRTSGYDAFE